MEAYGGFWLEGKQGNNVFAREKREKSDLKLRVPALKAWTLEDLRIGQDCVFIEEDEKGKVQHFLGLQDFLFFEKDGVPVYIFDNHNHALAFRYRELRKGTFEKGIPVVHIDQHSDMQENSFAIKGESAEEINAFVNFQCNVGNFIRPALASGLLSEVIQIRSEWGLLNYEIPQGDYLLDIDLDFRAPEMSIEQIELTFEKVRKLMQSAKVITIATSPYFLEQGLALELLRRIFGEESLFYSMNVE